VGKNMDELELGEEKMVMNSSWGMMNIYEVL
jgi:hypothetical protein